MKIYAIIVTLFLIIGCVHLSNNSSAVDIDGTWRGEVEIGTLTGIGKPGEPLRSAPPGKVTSYVFFNFKREGDAIKGTVSGRPGQWILLEGIKIKGKKISFAVTSMMFSTEVKTQYTGIIEGEKIKMSIKTEMPAIISGPGSPNPRVTEVNNRYKSANAGMGRGMDNSMEPPMGKDGLSLVYGYGMSNPGNPSHTYKITIERISKLP